jgi:hypothetical protein
MFFFFFFGFFGVFFVGVAQNKLPQKSALFKKKDSVIPEL